MSRDAAISRAAAARQTYGAVITGGALGIGREMALRLARDGYRIVLADIDIEAAERTAVDVRRAGGEASVVRCDVRLSGDVAELARRASDWLGPIDLLINNAGVLVTGELTALGLDDFRRVIDINLWGVIHGCHHFAPLMRAQGGGRIINVGSLAGAVPLPFMGAYNATKAAVIALSETLHAEMAASGVGVTVLCPSFTRTRIIDEASGAAPVDTMSTARTIMAYLGASPASVARVALEASERGRLYAIPSVHGRMAWRAKRLAPEGFKHAMRLAHRLSS